MERNDKKKWFNWIAEGKVGKAQMKTKIFEYFNKVDAQANFEKKFTQWTDNTWIERDYFQPKQGKFTIGNAKREEQKLVAARQTEHEILQILERANVIKSPETSNYQSDESDDVEPEMLEFLRFACNLNAFK